MSERMTGKILAMQKPIPSTESERLDEACGILMKLREDDIPRMTTWEVQLVCDLKEGKACTRIRLKELRDIVKRLYPNEDRP